MQKMQHVKIVKFKSPNPGQEEKPRIVCLDFKLAGMSNTLQSVTAGNTDIVQVKNEN